MFSLGVFVHPDEALPMWKGPITLPPPLLGGGGDMSKRLTRWNNIVTCLLAGEQTLTVCTRSPAHPLRDVSSDF